MLAIVVTVPVGEAELASDALWSLGVLAVEERDGPDGALVELWTSLGDDVEAVTRAAAAFPARWRWRLTDVDESVADEWRRHAVPTWIERDFVVHPAWIPVTTAAATVAVAVEPGATFGLGDHPTTVLTLRAMRRALFPGAVVLDVGCGSGVLAVSACVLGAARAEAIDINPAAVAVTEANAKRNAVGGAVTASTTPLAEITGPYDLVLANILAPALVELGGDLQRVLDSDGVLVVSGLLAGRDAHVRAALEPLRVIDVDERDGWEALTLRR
jgi:ribosomal protein L11 methyltransferase